MGKYYSHYLKSSMAMHISDLTKSEDEILVAMINADNGTQYIAGDFMYDAPEAIVNPVRNTRMKIYGVAPMRTSGETEVTYRRKEIQELPGQDRLSVCVQGMTRFAELIPTINVTLGINLPLNRFVDEPLPVFGDAPRGSKTTIQLVMTQDNPIYIGVLPVLIFV